MVTEVTPRHIKEYLNDELNPYTPIESLERFLEKSDNSGILFEAICECIVNFNKSYEIENLAEEYEKSDFTSPRNFADERLQKVLSKEVLQIMPKSQYSDWVFYTETGIKETDR